ncbi:MAG: GGDEF domain-containing phosphodiesterase [Lachnospiraceae bacterium]|nr:GGDEF domain-containing phosphodiesterase [Lachnospiraceae bacterium]
MIIPSFKIQEIKQFMKAVDELYDVVRIVDPSECKVIYNAADPDKNDAEAEYCHALWGRGKRCMDCASYRAAQSGMIQEKSEISGDLAYKVVAVPIVLDDENGRRQYCMELIRKVSEGDVISEDEWSENHDNMEFREVIDTLTGINNWEGFKDKAMEYLSLAADKKSILIRANIKDFKLVNQLYGRSRGNDILYSMAGMCREMAGNKGVYGRIMSDHFMILMAEEDFDEDALKRAAQKVVDRQQFGIYKVHIQFGLYPITDRKEDISIMCDKAQIALKAIESDHPVALNRYRDTMILDRLYSSEVISGFQEALQKDQMSIFLQPQNDKDGRLLSAEALVRWNHPEQGIVPPDRFIRVLENAGLIHELDTYIWEKTVIQLANWTGTVKENLPLSVNISPKDMIYIDIEKTFADLVRKYDVSPSRLNLEITESAVMADPEGCIELVKRLQDRGFKVEIDDFGTGYSSLNLLKDIQANVIKIDRAFLKSIEQEKRSEIILNHIISMAKELDMSVITEGVETKKQLDMMSDMGCKMFQGFYFSKPIPVIEFEAKYFEVK